MNSSEALLLYRDKISTPAIMPDAKKVLPYEGAKEMLLVDNVDDRAFLRDLVKAMVKDLLLVCKKQKYLCSDDRSYAVKKKKGLSER